MTEHVSATPRSVLTTKDTNRAHMEAVYSMASPSETDCISDMEDEEDEVFFGPMSTVELRKLHKFRDIHRRSTQVMQMTPLEDNTEKSQDTVEGAEKIQALFRGALARKNNKTKQITNVGQQCVTPEASPMPLNVQHQQLQAVLEMQRLVRGFLARRVYCRRREELRFLAVKGTISVERRRRIPRPTVRPLKEPPQTAPVSVGNGFGQQRALLSPPQAPLPLLPRDTPPPPRSPLRRGLSIRNWFQRQQQIPDSAPPLSNSKPDQTLQPSAELSSTWTNPLKPFSGNARRLRSPPPLQQSASTLLQGGGSQMVESDTQSAPQTPGIGKSAGNGTKLSMLKSGLGSLLTKPLSPRVATSRFQSHIPLPSIRGDSAIRSEPTVRAKIPAPIPVRRGILASSSMMRSDVDLNSTKTAVDVVYADMPLSAVGGGGTTFKSALRMASSDTDEESGIAATVARIAPSVNDPPSTTDFISTKSFADDASVSSISSMSASSALESPLSPVSNISANHMDISPPSTSCTSISRVTSQQSLEPVVTNMEDPLPTLKQKSKLDLSPRLSLRLSADAATFGTGLSVFASLLDDVRQHSTLDSAVDSSISDIIPPPAKGEYGVEVSLQNFEESGNAPVSIPEIDMDDSNELAVVEERGSPKIIPESCAMDCEPSAANIESPDVETESSAVETESLANDPVISTAEAETSAADAEQSEQVQKQSDMAADASEKTNPALERLRSLRTRRQREKGESVAPALTAATRRFRATQKAATTGSSGIKERPLAQMGALQLDRLTKLNTRRNATYMTCKIERVVEIRDGDRPPSPSLMMQLRAQERRMMTGTHSIYSSDSDEDYDAMSLCSNVDSEMNEDTRPLSPEPHLNSSTISGCPHVSAAELPDVIHMSSSEAKRKSSELASSSASSHISLTALDESANADGKKLCRRNNRLRWGTRSVLKASWLMGNDSSSSLRPAPSSLAARNTELASILVRPTPDTSSQSVDHNSGNAKSKRQSKNLEVIKVSCIEYPHSTTDALLDMEDTDSDEDISSPDPNDGDYIPR
ncbi:hypothetical protein COEREDRAFT_83658 [Coemansia reversa NRRL 1564]|uniref:Uncharacterized protein n=1 Tax=Coemansia reversa (strain ATCC 12441 / NRRL 1564) TaxID=763665 RepID=A0A2G5B2F0_COERN|nr:hypothetical protein COEREDRAFT_83658 [Coemansia reversa NRRL 1564]|eukprot:PIA13190.1 hypothetical protein COEREDRAFT_83658 [Coemansia reversa NRRL 1564]